MSAPTPPHDPARVLLFDAYVSVPTVYKAGCYICDDPEFAQMGLPLCYKCCFCSGHVPADDQICSDCHRWQMEEDD